MIYTKEQLRRNQEIRDEINELSSEARALRIEAATLNSKERSRLSSKAYRLEKKAEDLHKELSGAPAPFDPVKAKSFVTGRIQSVIDTYYEEISKMQQRLLESGPAYSIRGYGEQLFKAEAILGIYEQGDGLIVRNNDGFFQVADDLSPARVLGTLLKIRDRVQSEALRPLIGGDSLRSGIELAQHNARLNWLAYDAQGEIDMMREMAAAVEAWEILNE